MSKETQGKVICDSLGGIVDQMSLDWDRIGRRGHDRNANGNQIMKRGNDKA